VAAGQSQRFYSGVGVFNWCHLSSPPQILLRPGVHLKWRWLIYVPVVGPRCQICVYISNGSLLLGTYYILHAIIILIRSLSIILTPLPPPAFCDGRRLHRRPLHSRQQPYITQYNVGVVCPRPSFISAANQALDIWLTIYYSRIFYWLMHPAFTPPAMPHFNDRYLRVTCPSSNTNTEMLPARHLQQ
jgi:hypothetical protein